MGINKCSLTQRPSKWTRWLRSREGANVWTSYIFFYCKENCKCHTKWQMTRTVQTDPIQSLRSPHVDIIHALWAGPQPAGTSQVRTWTHSGPFNLQLIHSQRPLSNSPSPEHTQKKQNSKINVTYFVSRWEVLQSLLRVPKFICIHLSWQSKTWSVNHSVTPLQGGQKTPVAVLRIWQAWGEVPEEKTHVELPVKPDINSFWQAGLTESFPVRLPVDIPLCFIHLCRSRLRDAQPERKLGSLERGYGVRSAGLIPFLFK